MERTAAASEDGSGRRQAFPTPMVRAFMSSKESDVLGELQGMKDLDHGSMARQLLQVMVKLRLPPSQWTAIRRNLGACQEIVTAAQFDSSRHQTLLLSGSVAAMTELAHVLFTGEAEVAILAQELRDQLLWLYPRQYHTLRCAGRTLDFSVKTGVMGVLNVTPDSFSDGGRYVDLPAAVDHAHQMISAGADIIDIGGQSSRPGSDPVSASEEARRVLPVVEAVAKSQGAIISVDTYRAEIARDALDAGAHLINDISALRLDPALLEVVAARRATLILMHMKGMPRTMHLNPNYEALIDEVFTFFQERLRIARTGGIPQNQLLIDPGIGFGKGAWHNLEILNKLGQFQALRQPLVIGTSRKSFIGHILGAEVHERLEGTAATVAAAIAQGADVIRVHDVQPMVRVARMMDALVRPNAEPRRLRMQPTGFSQGSGDLTTRG
jgi:dihydropteroate synthase